MDKLHEILKSWGPWASNGQCLRARLFRSVYCSHVRSFLGPSSQAHNTSQCFSVVGAQIFLWCLFHPGTDGVQTFILFYLFPKKKEGYYWQVRLFFYEELNLYIFLSLMCDIYRLQEHGRREWDQAFSGTDYGWLHVMTNYKLFS